MLFSPSVQSHLFSSGEHAGGTRHPAPRAVAGVSGTYGATAGGKTMFNVLEHVGGQWFVVDTFPTQLEASIAANRIDHTGFRAIVRRVK